MGSFSSKICASCMSRQVEVSEAIERRETSNNGFDKHKILESLKESRDKLLDLVLEGMSNNGESVLADTKKCLVTGKECPDGFVVKYQWTISADPHTVISYLNNPLNRSDYDSNVESVCSVHKFDDDIEITKAVFKPQIGIDRREMLTASRIEKVHNGYILYSVSAQSDKYPVPEKNVRINVKVGGYFVEDLGRECKVTCASIADLKLNPVLTKLARVFIAGAIPNLAKKITKKIEERQ